MFDKKCFSFLLSLIVSDPLIQSGDKRGRVYNCMVSRETCSPVLINGNDAYTTFTGQKSISYFNFLKGHPFDFLLNLVTVPPEAINMSLGLSMTFREKQSVVSYSCNNPVFQLR